MGETEALEFSSNMVTAADGIPVTVALRFLLYWGDCDLL